MKPITQTGFLKYPESKNDIDHKRTAEAKKRGRKLDLRPDWEKVKISLMYEICMCKFMQNPTLRDSLLATGNALLVEGNNWGDYFWGKVNGNGENQLGLILMDVREKLRWSLEMEGETA